MSSSLNALAGAGTAFYLALGDLSYGQSPSPWCDSVESKLGPTYPFELVAGNHDTSDIDGFAACLPHRVGNIAGTYAKEYYFDYPEDVPLARVIMISPTLFGGSTQWLSGAIDGARALGIPWVIVGMHKVCITMGVKPCDIGAGLLNLMVGRKVDLILQAHEHNYQRSKQLALGPSCPSIQAGSFNAGCVVDDGADGAYTKGAGSLIVISGTFGRGLYNVSTGDSEARYFVRWMGDNVNPRKGFVKYDVSSEQISAAFAGSTSGSFTDAFRITGPAGSPPTTTTTTPPGPASAITFRSAAPGNNQISTSLTIPTPPGVQADDVMVAGVSIRGAPGVTPPPGWTLVRTDSTTSSSRKMKQAVYYRLASAGEPASHTWSFSGSHAAAGGILAYDGVSTSSPINAHGGGKQTSSSIVAPSITTTVPNAMLVGLFGIRADTTISPAPGMTERAETKSSGKITWEAADSPQASAGGTGSKTGTAPTSARNIGQLVALTPAG